MSAVARAVGWATEYRQYVRERGYLLEVGRFVLTTERQQRRDQRNTFDLGRDCGFYDAGGVPPAPEPPKPHLHTV